MKHNSNTRQMGRSLIEMLAVLAIIGILSVVALAGFSYGMNKHYANETMQEINQRLQTYLQQIDRGIALSYESGNKTYYNYPITAEFKDGKLAILLSDIPPSICGKLIPLATNFTVEADECCKNNCSSPDYGKIKLIYERKK